MPSRHVANWDRAKAEYPASTKLDDRDWVRFFNARPDIMHKLLGDIYVTVKAEEAKRRGEGKDGRRPKHVNGNLTELYEMITPRYALATFGDAIRELQGDLSLRAFAARVPMDHRELSRMMRGASRPSMYWMERIADAYKVNPAYFAEWRMAFVENAITAAFRAQPNLSIQAVKFLRTGRTGRA